MRMRSRMHSTLVSSLLISSRFSALQWKLFLLTVDHKPHSGVFVNTEMMVDFEPFYCLFSCALCRAQRPKPNICRKPETSAPKVNDINDFRFAAAHGRATAVGPQLNSYSHFFSRHKKRSYCSTLHHLDSTLVNVSGFRLTCAKKQDCMQFNYMLRVIRNANELRLKRFTRLRKQTQK